MARSHAHVLVPVCLFSSHFILTIVCALTVCVASSYALSEAEIGAVGAMVRNNPSIFSQSANASLACQGGDFSTILTCNSDGNIVGLYVCFSASSAPESNFSLLFSVARPLTSETSRQTFPSSPTLRRSICCRYLARPLWDACRQIFTSYRSLGQCMYLSSVVRTTAD